jgi:DNA-directed RNA polymerase specialized sigma24 family protein
MKRQGDNMEDRQFEEITERLDKLIRIVALSSTKGLTLTEKILLLHQAGFAPKEIADILATTSNVVNVRLSEMRKRGLKNEKKE